MGARQRGLWFAKIERDVIARAISSSVNDLHRKLMKHIKHYKKAKHPLREARIFTRACSGWRLSLSS